MITIGITLLGILLIVVAMSTVAAIAVRLLINVARNFRANYGGK